MKYWMDYLKTSGYFFISLGLRLKAVKSEFSHEYTFTWTMDQRTECTILQMFIDTYLKNNF